MRSLLLLIERALVTICTKINPREPGRSSPHLLTDSFQRDIRTALYDQFVVNVANDRTVGQGLHGIGQNVPGDCLDYVFDEFRAVRFNAAPLFVGIDPHVGDGFAAELILANSRFHVSQPSAGGQIDE